MTRYNNLHLNTHQSNIFKPDSIANYRQYAKRAKELGQKVLVAMEHCYSGNLFEAYTVAQEYGLKLLSGVDFNIRLSDGDYSLIMISKNNAGKTVINELISLASTQENILTVKDLLDNATKNVIITTSGINSVLLSKYADEVIKSLSDVYEIYIELQPHDTKMISEVNDLGLEWIDKGFQPILGLDTHYVSEDDLADRDIFLKSAKEFYFEEEDSVLDFPTYDVILQKFYDQGIVSNEIAELAIENTLIADEWEGISFDKEIKMITLYEGETHEQKVKRLHNLFNKAWVEDRKHIDKSKWNDYIEAIKFESNIITETGMEDYFLFNTKMIELGTTKYGGILTKSGRGCFEKTALVHTQRGLLPINEVKVGDFVINKFGEWDKVLKTWEYDIEEPMVEIQHRYQARFSPIIATLDHKILVRNENGSILYKKASDLIAGKDFVCAPIIKNNDMQEIVVDLADYANDTNIIEDDYIYEWDSNKKYTKRIKRYITLDEKFYYVLGMLYGDGCVQLTSKRGCVSLALNTKSHKNSINRKYYEEFAEMLDVSIYENISKNRNLTQLYINSKVLTRFFASNYFLSKRGVDKNVPHQLLSLPNKYAQPLYEGLITTDGSISSEGRISFDNTNLQIINLCKVLHMQLGYNPQGLMKRVGRVDNRGYKNSDSYKLRFNNHDNDVRKSYKIHKDENYFFLPIEKIIHHDAKPTKVYDLQVENDPSFTIFNMVVHNSAPSMYVNKLLNLTNIDRLEAPIELYPTRFMSISRILESRSLPDIDFNTSHPEPFVKASKELLGEHNAYQMVAYGTLQDKDAFRTYCRGLGLPVDEIADIPDKLEEYENHSMWGKLIKASKKFVGVIKSFSPHPCAMLLLNNDIRSETGVIKAKDGQYLALIDSYNSDVYKYLKNDVLTVSVYEIIGKVYESIGKPIDDVRTLIKNTQDDPKVWKLFEDGIVATLNQAGTVSGKPQIMQYAPKSIRELSMWVAAIRPSFATLRDTFLNRRPFSYNIPEFDALLQSSDNFILFQENIMKVLQYVGFPEGETYSLLKAIAKKKPGIIEPIHDRFIEGFVKQTGSEEDALEVWKIIENSVQYGFNSSHAYSVALDCLYGAYLKTNYPIDYYTETLNIYRDKVEMQGYLIEELPYFGIKLRGIKFGQSVRNYTHNGNEIFKGISTIKYLNDEVSDNMYDFYHNHYSDDMDIVDVFKYIIDNKLADNRQMNILIKLGFFYDINKNTSVLLAVYNSMTGYQSTKPIPQFLKHLGVTKLAIKYSTTLKKPQERINFLKQYLEFLSNNVELLPKFTLEERFAVEREYLGYLSTTLDSLENSYFIEEIGKGNNPWFTLYDLSTGLQRKIRGLKKDITDPNGKRLIGVGDIIEIHATKDLPKNILVDGKWTKSADQTEPYLAKISILSKEKLSKLL